MQLMLIIALAWTGSMALAAEPELVDPDVPATEAPEDSLWELVEAVDGEPPTTEEAEAFAEQAEQHFSELALVEELGGGVDVPLDWYADPAVVLHVDPLHLDELDPTEFDIPIVVNDQVIKWMRYFLGPGRKYYARWLSRSGTYRPLMRDELTRAGLPHDLVYLSMIESGYNAHAYSHAHAAGLWQFMPATGRMYDLDVDWWVDQRRDPVASTRAGVRYLADLHKMFDGDWYLAWASYNGGPGRVSRAVRSTGTRDFWLIAQGSSLHTETENYVPKILAAAIIGKHPERYGFPAEEGGTPWAVDVVEVEGAAEVSVLAECAGMSVERFKHLNPALRRWATPPEGTTVNVPAGRRAAFTAALAKVPLAERVSFVRHEVHKGQTLSSIAAKYDVSVAEVVRVNQLESANRIYVGMKLVIPMAGANPQAVSAAVADTPPVDPPVSATVVVKSGDTLSGIASKFGVSVSDLMRWNSLSSTNIRIGQKIEVRGGKAAERYTVVSGDTLSAIATRFRVTVSEIMRWNGIKDPSLVRVGQTLLLAAPQATWLTVTVAVGDSLGKLASLHGCSVSDLQKWNGLSGTVIHPGQRLKVRAGG